MWKVSGGSTLSQKFHYRHVVVVNVSPVRMSVPLIKEEEALGVGKKATLLDSFSNKNEA